MIDDELAVLELLEDLLDAAGFDAFLTHDPVAALQILSTSSFDVVLSDINMPRLDGLELLRQVRQLPDPPEVVMVTGRAESETVAEALRSGALDYVLKPAPIHHIVAAVKNGLARRAMSRLGRASCGEEKIGETVRGFHVAGPASARLYAQAVEVAGFFNFALVTGPEGSGKSTFVELLHHLSDRAAVPMVRLAVKDLTPETWRDLLIGSPTEEEGKSFSPGALLSADGGFLCLDGIESTPDVVQEIIGKYLDQGTVNTPPLEGDEIIDVRLLATTALSFKELRRESNLQPHFLHRLGNTVLAVPPLADRRDEALPLAKFILNSKAADLNRDPWQLAAHVETAIGAYEWPGDVGEISRSMSHVAQVCPGQFVTLEHLPESVQRKFYQADRERTQRELKEKDEARKVAEKGREDAPPDRFDSTAQEPAASYTSDGGGTPRGPIPRPYSHQVALESSQPRASVGTSFSLQTVVILAAMLCAILLYPTESVPENLPNSQDGIANASNPAPVDPDDFGLSLADSRHSVPDPETGALEENEDPGLRDYRNVHRQIQDLTLQYDDLGGSLVGERPEPGTSLFRTSVGSMSRVAEAIREKAQSVTTIRADLKDYHLALTTYWTQVASDAADLANLRDTDLARFSKDIESQSNQRIRLRDEVAKLYGRAIAIIEPVGKTLQFSTYSSDPARDVLRLTWARSRSAVVQRPSYESSYPARPTGYSVAGNHGAEATKPLGSGADSPLGASTGNSHGEQPGGGGGGSGGDGRGGPTSEPLWRFGEEEITGPGEGVYSEKDPIPASALRQLCILGNEKAIMTQFVAPDLAKRVKINEGTFFAPLYSGRIRFVVQWVKGNGFLVIDPRGGKKIALDRGSLRFRYVYLVYPCTTSRFKLVNMPDVGTRATFISPWNSRTAFQIHILK